MDICSQCYGWMEFRLAYGLPKSKLLSLNDSASFPLSLAPSVQLCQKNFKWFHVME